MGKRVQATKGKKTLTQQETRDRIRALELQVAKAEEQGTFTDKKGQTRARKKLGESLLIRRKRK